MEESILYFPENYRINGYDILFCRALSNSGSRCSIVQTLETHSLIELKNNELSYYNIDPNPGQQHNERKVVTKYFCNRCQALLSWKDIYRIGEQELYTLGFFRKDNIFLIFPYYSSREIPKKWIRIEGHENVYYIDAQTYNIFNKFLKKGTSVGEEVIKISFPDSINYPVPDVERIGLIRFKYSYGEKRCRYCNGRAEKKLFKEVMVGDELIGYISQNGKMYQNENGKIITYLLSNKDKTIYLPKELYNSRKKFLSNMNLTIRPYNKVGPSEILIAQFSRTIRNMKQITSDGNDFMDSIAINYVESLKKELRDIIIEGDYDGAVKKFYDAVKIFDLFFIQGCRKPYGIPKSAINLLEDTFESLFNGEKIEIARGGEELDERWKNFINLFINVERVKGKVRSRRYTFNNIVISTIGQLPPEDEMKKILNVRELQVIQGKWHGVKFIVKPNIEKIGKYYKNYASKIAFLLSKKEAKDIISKIEKGDYYLGIEGQSLRITREMVTIVPKLPEGYEKGTFKLGEFYLFTNIDGCQKQLYKLIRKINYERHKLRMRRDDPVDVILPNEDCKEEIELNEKTIIEKTNSRKIVFGDDFKIIPFYRSNIILSVSRYLGVNQDVAENLVGKGVENLYLLQVGDPLSLPIKDQELRARILEARNKKIDPIDQIDRILCTLCNGEVENNVCEKCGYNYGPL